MKSNDLPIEEQDLHAYVDGQLGQQRREIVEAWLLEHPEDAQRVEEFQKQNQAMHAMFDPVLSEPVPEGLTTNPVVQQNSSQHKSALFRFAAAVGYLFVGSIIGYAVHDANPTPAPYSVEASLPRQAALAHAVYTPEVVHPVEVTADQEAHLTKWLSKRLGKDLRVPHLSPLGFNLVGGRLLPGSTGPAAQFMYENSQGKRLTLYVKNVEDTTNETAFRYNQQDGVSVFYWVDGTLGYAISGEIEKQGLLKAANEVYRALNT